MVSSQGFGFWVQGFRAHRSVYSNCSVHVKKLLGGVVQVLLGFASWPYTISVCSGRQRLGFRTGWFGVYRLG